MSDISPGLESLDYRFTGDTLWKLFDSFGGD